MSGLLSIVYLFLLTLVACQFLSQFGLMNWYLEAKYVGGIGKVT